MKRLTAMLLSMTMLLGLMVPMQAAEAQTDWEKAGFLSEPAVMPPVAEAGKLLASVGEPEEGAQPISTVEEFLAAKSGSWYLKNDLDLSSVTGTISLTKTLTIDGQGHKLTGLSVTLYQDYFYGVDLTLKNLLVETADEGVKGSAVLVGNWPGNLQIENCTVSGRLTGGIGSQVGGLATSVPKDGKLVNCAFFGNITAAEKGTYVGGLVCSSGADISNCVFGGTINGGTYVGGITSGSSGAIRSCRAEGSIASAYSAGVVYSGVNGEAVDCIASMDGATCGLVYEGKAVNCVVTDADLKGPGIGGEATGCAVYNSTCVGGGISISGDVIRDCLVENTTITGTADVGGIAYGKSLVSGCAVRNCTITAVGEDGVAGGIVGNTDYGTFEGQPGVYDCVVEDTVITGYAVAGGIAGKGFPTLINCSVKGGSVTATGEAAYIGDINSYTGGYAGGILGFIDNSQDCAILSCTADTVVTGYSAGGVAGYFYSSSGTATVQDCHSTGTVTGKYCAGGIVGAFSGTARKCTSEATVKVLLDEREDPADYAVVGGLIGYFSQGLLEESTFNGMVSGTADTNAVVSALGGLVGIQFDSSWSTTTCTVQRCVFQGAIQGTADYMGGILGASGYRSGSQMAFTVLDCEVTQPEGRTTLYISGDKPFEGVGSKIGGIVGSAGGKTGIYRTVINCDLSVSGKPANVGGLAGGFGNNGYVYAEHCTINGDLSVTATGTVGVGGFGCGNISVAGCWINGDVMVSAPEEVIENEGAANESRYASFVGTITAIRGRSSWYYESGFAADCEMTFNGTVVTEPVAQRQTTYTFKTFDESGRLIDFYIKGGYYDSGETFPLNGAKITVGNVTGYTDSTGMAALELEESAFQSAVEVRIQREGYDDFVDLHAFATNQDYSATLWKLDPGKIFITGGTVRLTEYVTRDIFGTAKTIILQEDELAYPISVTINWNGHEPDKVCLFGEESGKRVDLTINGNVASGNVVFGGTQNTFLPDEMIRVYATTKNTKEFGVINAVRLTSIKVKPLDVNINVTDPGGATVSDEEDPDKFFLQGSKVKLDLGDLAGCASSVTLKNGIITVSFGKKDGEKKKGDLFTLDDAYSKDEVSVTGSISIPYQALLTNPEEAEWSGEIKVGLNNTTGFSDNAADAMKDMIQGVENDMPIHEDIWDFTVAGVPCYVKASVGVYAGATLKAFGSAEKVSVTGQLNGGATGKVGGGVGGAIGEDVIKYKDHAAIEVMAGLYGSVSGDFAVSMEAIPRGDYDLETKFDMTPTVSGEVGGEVIVHVFMLELENKLKLGSFTWTDEGIEWFLAGEEGEVKALSLGDTSEEWGLLGRDYREKLSLLAESNPNVLKENVIGSSQTAVDASFFYVDEDPSVPVEQQYNALRLYVLDRYGYATMVDKADDNTSDHSPYAYSYTDTNWNTVQGVTWVDVKEQSEADLAQFLQDGRIAFSAYDYDARKYGDKVIVASAGENNRVYHPVLGASCIAWLESPIQSENGNLLLMPDSVKLWMSTTSDGGATWSTPVCVKQLEDETISEIITVTTSAITYRAGDTLYTINTSDGSVKDTVTDRALYGVSGTFSGWQSEAGLELQYQWGKTVSRKTYALSSELTQAPIFVNYNNKDYCYFVTGNQIWRIYFYYRDQTWYAPVLVAETEGAIRELRVKEDELFYLADDGQGGTDLYWHSGKTQYPIHSIRQENGMIIVAASGSVWAYDDSKTYSPTRKQTVDDKTFYYFPLSELPVGELYFSTESHERAYTIRESKAEVLLTEADFEEDGTLRARLISNAALGEDIQFTLSAYGTETVIDSWTGDERYNQNMFYETVYDGNELEDGAYVLTAAYGTVQSSILVGKGDPLAEEETVESSEAVTENGETTIRLMDSGKQLSGSVLVLAARYEKGQMKESTFGTAEGGEGIWDLILPEQVTEGWKLFLLDSITKAPLCEPIVVQ